MPIASGATIGPYKVDREIGRGGMGIVFLARDTRLGRTVALKALPDDVASDPDRLQRFEREARVLASLNHPNIAAIYGLEESEGRRYLALEHVEGETLAQRIARGPLPLAETLDFGIQIAAGMEAAHDGGVVHRDLKPGNVMITGADQIKILDFGLAKGRVATDEAGLAKSPAGIPTASSPTLTSPAFPDSPTLPGVILGTAAYLSPEQARGKTVDRRTDIWSFGCIVYECLAGKRAFQAETTSDMIAKILEHDPDWTALPRNTPPRLRALLERCLTKDPKRRLRDIGEARLALEEIKSGRHSTAGAADAGAAPDSRAARRATLLAAAAALAIGTALGALAWSVLGTPSHKSRTGMIHLAINLPQNTLPLDGLIAPDGSKAVMLAIPHGQGEDTRPRLYVRRMDQESFAPLAGTEGAMPGITMSPDGRWIAFKAPASEQSTRIRVFKVPVDGSSRPVAIADAADNWDGQGLSQIAWLESGDLLVSADNATSYVLLPSSGGTPTPPRRFDASGVERFTPQRGGLPGGHEALLSASSYEGGVYRQGVSVLDLRSGKVKGLIRDGGSPTYLPHYLLFTRQDALFAVRFDPRSLEVKGEPIAIIGGIRQAPSWSHASYTLASNGTIGYIGGGRAREGRHLVILDRDGKATEWSGDKRGFEFGISVSPDGDRCLASINSPDAITEVWVAERGRTAMRRIPTRPGADCMNPIWSPDGRRVAYFEGSLGPKDGVYVATVDGSAPARLLAATRSSSEFLGPTSWSPDGSWIAVTQVDGPKATPCVIPASPASGTPVTPRGLFQDDAVRVGFAFSPDGRRVAYITLETGTPEVAVCGWVNEALTGDPVLVSTAQPTMPRWSRDGKHLYFRTVHEKIAEVDIVEAPRVTGSPAHLTASQPRDVWDMVALRVSPSQQGSLYDILPDGRLLAVQASEEEGVPTQAEILLNVTDEIEKRMKAAGK